MQYWEYIYLIVLKIYPKHWINEFGENVTGDSTIGEPV